MDEATYSVLSEAMSLSEEQDAEDGRDGCLSQSEEEEGRLQSSAHHLYGKTHKTHDDCQGACHNEACFISYTNKSVLANPPPPFLVWLRMLVVHQIEVIFI